MGIIRLLCPDKCLVHLFGLFYYEKSLFYMRRLRMETKVQAPSECERTQKIVVTSDFVSALKRAMNWGEG